MNITLATLNQTPIQDVFDKVVTHMLTQNRASLSEDGEDCMYRGEDGMSCAVGCLIGAEEYDESMEHTRADDVMRQAGVKISDDMMGMLLRLQEIHDGRGIEDAGYDENAAIGWPVALGALADSLKLTYPKILEERLAQPSMVA